MPTPVCTEKEESESIDPMAYAVIASHQLVPATRGDGHNPLILPPLGYVKSRTDLEFMSLGAETEQRQATIDTASSSWSISDLMSLGDNKATSPTRTSTVRSEIKPSTQPDPSDEDEDDDDSSEIQTTIEEDLCLRLSNMHLTAPPSYIDSPIYKLTEHNVFGISRPPAYTPPLPGWRSTPPFNEWRYQDDDQSEWALRRRRSLVAEKLEAESRGSYVGYRSATAPSPTPQPLELEHAYLLRSTLLEEAVYRSTVCHNQLPFRRFHSTRSLFGDSSYPAIGPYRGHRFDPFPRQLQRFLQTMIKPKTNTPVSPASRKGDLNRTGTPRNQKIKPENENVEDDERTAIPKHNRTLHLHGIREGGCTCCPEGVVRKRWEVKGLGRIGTDFRERGTARGDGEK